MAIDRIEPLNLQEAEDVLIYFHKFAHVFKGRTRIITQQYKKAAEMVEENEKREREEKEKEKNEVRNIKGIEKYLSDRKPLREITICAYHVLGMFLYAKFSKQYTCYVIYDDNGKEYVLSNSLLNSINKIKDKKQLIKKHFTNESEATN